MGFAAFSFYPYMRLFQKSKHQATYPPYTIMNLFNLLNIKIES